METAESAHHEENIGEERGFWSGVRVGWIPE